MRGAALWRTYYYVSGLRICIVSILLLSIGTVQGSTDSCLFLVQIQLRYIYLLLSHHQFPTSSCDLAILSTFLSTNFGVDNITMSLRWWPFWKWRYIPVHSNLVIVVSTVHIGIGPSDNYTFLVGTSGVHWAHGPNDVISVDFNNSQVNQ